MVLWRSIQRYDPHGVLWVLCLDGRSEATLRSLADASLRLIALENLERSIPDLVDAKSTRSRAEYYFTLTPAITRWILQSNTSIERLTYVDADMMLFGSLDPIWEEMDRRRASVLVTEHRFSSCLRHYLRHGRFNVGILSFRADLVGMRCVARWERQCREWCYDRIDGTKYADQGYLTSWPDDLGASLYICEHPGVNLAPWNWRTCRIETKRSASSASTIAVNGQDLLLYHYARFRPILGTWIWLSGQLDYGVMPSRLRAGIYSPYYVCLATAVEDIRRVDPKWSWRRRSLRLTRGAIREALLRLLFGSDWLRIGRRFYSVGFGLGPFSGQFLAYFRTTFLRKKRSTDAASNVQHATPGK